MMAGRRYFFSLQLGAGLGTNAGWIAAANGLAVQFFGIADSINCMTYLNWTRS